MGERKVLNKYYPPDFDPAKLPRGQRGNKDAQMKVRMMLAMSVRCNTCGNYMYKGTKFNMRMEDVVGEDYLGIRIFRFYFHCKNCSAEITMKTDPKNSDYAMEQGATRNYEPWRDKEKTVTEAVAAREEEERGNAMKALENRTLDSKREMDIMDALEELQALNGRHGKVDQEAALAALRRSAQTDEEAIAAEDEAQLRVMMQARSQHIKRLEQPQASGSLATSSAAGSAATGSGWADAAAAEPVQPPSSNGAAAPAAKPKFAVKPRIVVQPKKQPAQPEAAGSKRPADEAEPDSGQPAAKKSAVVVGRQQDGGTSPSGSDGAPGGALLGLGDYGSESSDGS